MDKIENPLGDSVNIEDYDSDGVRAGKELQTKRIVYVAKLLCNNVEERVVRNHCCELFNLDPKAVDQYLTKAKTFLRQKGNAVKNNDDLRVGKIAHRLDLCFRAALQRGDMDALVKLQRMSMNAQNLLN